MTERFKTTEGFGYGPAIMDYFAAIPENKFSYNHYSLRHPGGIYNLVTNRLITDILVLSDKIKNYNEQSDDIYPYFRLMIYDLFKFYDSCFEIMLCFAEPFTDKPGPKDFIDKWLVKKNYSCVKDFKNDLDTDIKFLKNLYNKLKHTSNEIRFLTVNHRDSIGFGYWLEVANDQGGVMPENDTEFPISIAREIRRVQYIIYKLSDTLFNVLRNHVDLYFPDNNYLTSERLRDTDDFFFLHLNDAVVEYPDFYLLNEKDKLFYKGEFVELDNKNFIDFTENVISDQILNKYYTPLVSGGYMNSNDGYTRSFTMPHMGIIKEDSEWALFDKTQQPPRLL